MFYVEWPTQKQSFFKYREKYKHCVTTVSKYKIDFINFHPSSHLDCLFSNATRQHDMGEDATMYVIAAGMFELITYIILGHV